MFLSIITRHAGGRPELFDRLKESLAAQTCQDFEHIIVGGALDLYDANYGLYLSADDLSGDYVMAIDDDDRFPDEKTVENLKKKIGKRKAGIGRAVCEFDVELPTVAPQSISCIIARRDVWQKCVGACRIPRNAPGYLLACIERECSVKTLNLDIVVRDRQSSIDDPLDERKRRAWYERWPMVAFEAECLDAIPRGRVLAFGSHNAHWLSLHAEAVVAVEYDMAFFGLLDELARKRSMEAIKVAPEMGADDPLGAFADARLPGGTFDAVIIESRCPPQCIARAIELTTPEGVIALNAPDALRYAKFVGHLEDAGWRNERYHDGDVTTAVFRRF